MANPLPNEEALYAQIKSDGITVPPVVWDMLYHYLGDYISTIMIISEYSLEKQESMSVDDAKTILGYTRKIIDAVSALLHPQKKTEDDKGIGRDKKDKTSLHPIVKEFFAHYISNDTNCINFLVSYYLDPAEEGPVPIGDVEKILTYARSMQNFLDKLRVATHAA